VVSFDTNVLVYATASISDVRVTRARDLIARAMRAPWSVLLLQTLAEFSSVGFSRGKFPSMSALTITVMRNAAQARLRPLRADYLCCKFLMRSWPCACDIRGDRRSPNPFPGVANLHGEMGAFSPPSE
jgi:hypothetical protein